MFILEETRRKIIDELRIKEVCWYGLLDELDFLKRIFDIKSMQSEDNRFNNMEEDFKQHRINNADWDNNWIYEDSRLNLMRGDDEVFLKFLSEMINPVVRDDLNEVQSLLKIFNDNLQKNNFKLDVKKIVSKKPIYHAVKIDKIEKKEISKIDLILSDYIEKIGEINLKSKYIELYGFDYGELYTKIFAYFHQEINGLFNFLNEKNGKNKYYNADQSRELIDIIDKVNNLSRDLITYGDEVILCKEYKNIFSIVRIFLESSGGSRIPDSFSKIKIINYEPIFSLFGEKILINSSNKSVNKKYIGEGAFSNVYKYKDPDYNKFFAIKTIKKESGERDIERLKNEFKILKGLNFPYILEVYSYNDEKNEYSMEYCDNTLKKYIEENNTKICFATKKRVALQFLYAINYLHSKKIFHRDISYNNVLIKKFDKAIVVKLSDFGLMKEQNSNFTKTDTEVKGTIIDPALECFKDYSLTNEIYAVGFILNFIFTGKKSYKDNDRKISKIVKKCIDTSLLKRYKDVGRIITAVELINED